MAAINYKDHLLWQQKERLKNKVNKYKLYLISLIVEKGQAVIKQVKLIIPQK